MNEIEVTFAASGTVTQTIRLNTNITKEEFVAGLRNGTILTSVGHGATNGRVYQLSGEEGAFAVGGLKEIGVVVEQEAGDDMEFSDFSE